MEAWIVSFIEKFGYLGVFLMIGVENVFPPIPSEVILSFGGFMTTKTSMTIPGVIVASTLGAVVGAVVLYLVGSLLGKHRIHTIVEKYGRFLRLRHSDIDKAYGWFERYEKKTVFFCRMIPLIRSLISIPAGMAQMRLIPFLLLTTAGSLIWNTLLVSAGALLGEAWDSILGFLGVYSSITYGLLGVAAVGLVAWLFLRKQSH